MSPPWTTEQILALAPDANSAKAGQDLARPRKWLSLGYNEQAAWGECQGSGKTPYQTQIDLTAPAFRCSCPSRKFPCKHSLGLFLLLAGQTSAFSEKTPPSWVVDWLSSRAKKNEQRAAKAEQAEQPTKPPDPTAQARRAAAREAKVKGGLDELKRWLCDLVRMGLAMGQKQPPSFWDGQAARLVDAQAPGVARVVRELESLAASGANWQERLLQQLGRIYLLLEGYKRLETLAPPLQAEIRSLIGWTKSQAELLAEPAVRDRWSVAGQYVEEEDRLRVQYTWLWSNDTRRAALVLQFAHGSQPLDTSLMPGTWLDAEAVFYPGAYPLRAIIKARHSLPDSSTTLAGYDSIAQAMAAYAAALAQNPWLGSFPLALAAVIPFQQDNQWVVRDQTGLILSITPRAEQGWQLLALSGGRPLDLFGEWDGTNLRPLGVCVEGRYISF